MLTTYGLHVHRLQLGAYLLGLQHTHVPGHSCKPTGPDGEEVSMMLAVMVVVQLQQGWLNRSAVLGLF